MKRRAVKRKPASLSVRDVARLIAASKAGATAQPSVTIKRTAKQEIAIEVTMVGPLADVQALRVYEGLNRWATELRRKEVAAEDAARKRALAQSVEGKA